MLRDLTIQNYRCFKDFHIDALARVNLIVGSNNSGKTSLLEAIYLLVNQGNPQSIVEMLSNRDEMAEWYVAQTSSIIQQRLPGYQINHIFNDRQLKAKEQIHIQSQQENPISLQINLTPWDKDRSVAFEFVPAFALSLQYKSEDITQVKLVPVREDGVIERKSIESDFFNASTQVYSPLFLSTKTLSFYQMAILWDNITLTPEEEKVVAALQILEPDVERISFASRPTYNSGILLKIRGQRHPIPLSSMGEGMRRLLTLAMAAVTVENGLLLVDEIETGLYYEAQTDMWRLILQTAQRLNLQVFATTHSWDCIAAFQEALAEFEDNSIGKLFRLNLRDDNIRPVAYTAEELAIAIPHSIEVR
ncbi:AAA family ATPase [Aerosakkonema funiforme]|uniref:AAA family ATPase n=1 Tax=Aerosakkonema funiforme TaxID=1246630 RepID=UPI0035BAF0D6